MNAATTVGSLSRPLALLVAGAFFMELLDGTVLATAAPRVAASLAVPVTAMAAPISAYLVTVAAFIPASGWVVDRFGGRRTFAIAIGVFTAASALCAAAPNLGVLTTARVVQGLGGALMVPVGRLVVLRDVRHDEMLRAVAFLTWPALFAPLVGPVVGGIVATYASWRWIFLINLPLGAIAACCCRLVPPTTGPRRPLDVGGLASMVLSVGCVTAAAAILSEPKSRMDVAIGLLVVAVLSGALGVGHLRRTPAPLVRFEAFRVATFRTSHVGGSVFRTAVNAVPFLLSLLFVERFGWTPARAGLLVAALFAGNLAMKPATSPLLRRTGFRTALLAAVLGSAITVGLFATLENSTPPAVIVALLFLSGAFRSLGFTAYNTMAYADLDAAHMTDANTLSSTVQQLALGCGAALGALTLHAGFVLTPDLAYAMAFLMIAALFVAPCVEVLRLPSASGVNLTRSSSCPKCARPS